jgi:hypothetical protein
MVGEDITETWQCKTWNKLFASALTISGSKVAAMRATPTLIGSPPNERS